MSSAGISLHWILPSAFVSLSPASLGNSSPWSQIRIAAGGAWHNWLLWAALLLPSMIGMCGTNLLLWPAYENMVGAGRVVVSIARVRYNGGRLLGGILTLMTGLTVERYATPWYHHLVDKRTLYAITGRMG